MNHVEPSLAEIEGSILAIQQDILVALEAASGDQFQRQKWQQSGFGHGLTAYVEKGTVLERAVVTFSHVQGLQLPHAATIKRSSLAGHPFVAVGLSLVIHPRNPYVPTVHLNVRMIEVARPQEQVRWFGGGMDLTPYYPFIDDVRQFHRCCRDACDAAAPDLYLTYKKQCDAYFYLAHRQEPRGVGGVFYDDVQEHGFALTRQLGQAFIAAYLPIITHRKETPYGEREKNFQLWRRGRYVEFNLLYDRGTMFGLQSKGRTEAILLSLPPYVEWRYDWKPEPSSPEEKLFTEFLIPPRDWL